MQAQIYQEVLATCLAKSNSSPGCIIFTTWGFTDKYTWIAPPKFPADAPLPFDTTYAPKPAFFSLQKTLQTPPP